VLLVQDRRCIAVGDALRLYQQLSVPADTEAVYALVSEADIGGISAGTHDEFVFQLSAIRVIDQIDVRIQIEVSDAPEEPQVLAPLRRIASLVSAHHGLERVLALQATAGICTLEPEHERRACADRLDGAALPRGGEARRRRKSVSASAGDERDAIAQERHAAPRHPEFEKDSALAALGENNGHGRETAGRGLVCAGAGDDMRAFPAAIVTGVE